MCFIILSVYINDERNLHTLTAAGLSNKTSLKVQGVAQVRV